MSMDRRALLKLLLGAAATPGLARARFAVDPFSLGVASGAPDHHSVVLWTRLMHAAPGTGAITVRWEMAEDENFRRIVRKGEASALPQLGHSVHVEPDGLMPDRWYFYRFMLGDAVSVTGRTRTFPAPDVLAPTMRFAFASCQRWEHGHYAAYRHMLADAPDCVLFVGDYIYEYPSPKKGAVRSHALAYPESLDDYRDRYALYKSDPALQAMHAACPWLLTWDDHEVHNNYAGLRSNEEASRFAARRLAAYQAYYENMPLRASCLLRGIAGLQHNDAMRIYARLSFGRLASFHILDDRQYRDFQACRDDGGKGESLDPQQCTEWAAPARTLLGREQEQWLDAAFAQTAREGARWTVIAHQTVFTRRDSRLGPDEMFGNDNWNGYPAARTRLLESLQGHRPRNPVFVGGDIHQNWVADVRVDDRRMDAPVIAAEFVGTSISSNSGTSLKRAEALMAENPHCLLNNPEKRGYGLVDITPQRWRTQLRVVDDVRNPAAGISTLASFVVEDGRAGIVREG